VYVMRRGVGMRRGWGYLKQESKDIQTKTL
jgi:hypothetical protein